MRDEEEFDLYQEKNREDLTESDELNPAEEGFMQGYDEDSNPSQCANCGKILEKKFLEEKIKGETYRFCSDECASKFERQKEHI